MYQPDCLFHRHRFITHQHLCFPLSRHSPPLRILSSHTSLSFLLRYHLSFQPSHSSLLIFMSILLPHSPFSPVPIFIYASLSLITSLSSFLRLSSHPFSPRHPTAYLLHLWPLLSHPLSSRAAQNTAISKPHLRP